MQNRLRCGIVIVDPMLSQVGAGLITRQDNKNSKREKSNKVGAVRRQVQDSNRMRMTKWGPNNSDSDLFQLGT